jgi:hypothetical protein
MTPIVLEWKDAFDADYNIAGYELSYKTNGDWSTPAVFIPSSATGGSYSFTPTQQIDHTFRIRIVDSFGEVSGYQYFLYPISPSYQISNYFDNQGPVATSCQISSQPSVTYSPIFLSSTPPAVGVTVYTNSGMTSNFIGQDFFWIIKSPSGLEYSCRILNNGVIQEIHLCGNNSGTRSSIGKTTANTTCSLLATDANIYWNSVDSFSVGTILYTNSDCTSVFNGGGLYYMMQYTDPNGVTPTKVVHVGILGNIVSIVDKVTVCGIIRSGSRTDANADCNSAITNTCYISSADPITIATNDIVYTNSQGTMPFSGGDLVYRVFIATIPTTNQVPVLCKITNDGKVTVTGYCSIYGGGTNTGGSYGSGPKIICNLLYKQGYLSREIWEADEKFGRLMMKTNKEGLLGYLIWAKPTVNFLNKNPKYSRYVYVLTKPWHEHMAFMMGVLPQDNKLGKAIHYVGNKFSIMIYKFYSKKRRRK